MTEHIDHNHSLRGPGRTTRQIVNAPLNAVYVWVDGNLSCPELIARKYGRVDIVFVRPGWLRHENLRGHTGGIVIDHAATLTGAELEVYHKWKSWIGYRAGSAKATKNRRKSMKTIQLTDEQYNALMQGQSITIEPPKPEKWEPKGGEWLVSSYGNLHRGVSVEHPRLFGVEYSTKEAAEKARDAMLVHNRLLAWLSENDDGWVADWDNDEQAKWSVHYSFTTKSYRIFCNHASQCLGSVYMSQNNAEKLAELLNDGVVDL